MLAHARLSITISLLLQLAMFNFTAREDDELSLSIGDEIVVQEKIEGGWWLGRCGDVVGLSQRHAAMRG